MLMLLVLYIFSLLLLLLKFVVCVAGVTLLVVGFVALVQSIRKHFKKRKEK